MAPGISLPRSLLAATIVESILYGMYTVLCGIALFLLIAKRSKNRVTIVLIVFTLLMFSIATAHEGVLIHYTMTEFLYNNAAGNGENTLDRSGDPRIYAGIILEVINCITGDTIVIWRAWALWGHKSKAVMLPMFFWFASVVSGIGCSRAFVVAPPGESGLLSSKEIVSWGVVFMTSTFMTNCTSVLAITYRYWLYRREVFSILGRQDSSNHGILTVVIESGILYCFTWCICLIVYLTGSRGLYVVVEALSQLTGIYPTLIVVLVCLKLTQRDEIDKLHHSTMRFDNNASATATGMSSAVRTDTTSYQMHPIHIRVHETKTYNSEGSSDRTTVKNDTLGGSPEFDDEAVRHIGDGHDNKC